MKDECKTLTLIRHAKAEQGTEDMRDIDRPLKQKGEKQATRLGKWLREHHFNPDMLWSSPSARTHMSARIILDCANAPLSILQVRNKLYLADAAQILSMIQKAPPEIRHLAIVGHNPGIAELISRLAPSATSAVPPGATCTPSPPGIR
ncbi:MAG: histidine phosphatase family protein [Geobacteraceae bacterium]|nr:histidine phosphatase family protein [Geobacteraceae bacterium]